MAIKKFDAFVKENTGHEVEVYGKKYVIPHVAAGPALEFARVLGIAAKVKKAEDAGDKYEPTDHEREILESGEETDLYREALSSPIYEQMLADGVPFTGVKAVATYVLLHAVKSPDEADAWLRSGGKAPAPNRKARRTATRTRTAEGASTR